MEKYVDVPQSIKKADSKGRLSGFTPHEHYWVDSAGSDFVIRGVVRAHDIQVPASRYGLDYLRSFGLDPNEVARDGANEKGFFRFTLDADGKRIWGKDRAVSEWQGWPDGFDYFEFVRQANRTD